MTHGVFRAALPVLFLCLAVGTASAAVKVGDKVVPTVHAKVMFGQKMAAYGVEHVPFTVGHVTNDGWCYIGTNGYIGRANLMELDYNAVHYYTRLIHNAKYGTWARHMRAACWIEMGYYQRAVDDCDMWLQNHSDDAAVYHLRGQAHAGLGRYEEAKADFDAAIELRPDYTAAYKSRGWWWMEQNNHKKAAADFKLAAKHNPKSASAYRYLAEAQLEMKMHKQALESYDMAIAAAPGDDKVDAKAFEGKGRIWEMMGNDKLAVRAYHVAHDYNPDLEWASKRLELLQKLAPAKATAPMTVEVAYKQCEATKWKKVTLVYEYAKACADVGDFRTAYWAMQKLQGLSGKKPLKKSEIEREMKAYKKQAEAQGT